MAIFTAPFIMNMMTMRRFQNDLLSVGRRFALKSSLGSLQCKPACQFDPTTTTEDYPLVKPNYNFAKRQRELAKKAKKEEKQQRKAAGDTSEQTDGSENESAEGEATPPTPDTPAA